MGRTACTEPQCLYKGALYLTLYRIVIRTAAIGFVCVARNQLCSFAHFLRQKDEHFPFCSSSQYACLIIIIIRSNWLSNMSIDFYGLETWTLGKSEERVVKAFETWCWRKMLKIKWTDRITNDEVYQRAKEERLLLKFLKNRRHLWIGHTIRHNEFVVNIIEGAISGKKAVGRPRLQ